jgi:type I restriction enzyme S subunit
VSIHTGVSDEEAAQGDSERKIVRSEDRSKYKRVSPNDLTYNMMRAWQGGFGTVQVEGMVSPAYVVARPRTEIPSRFIELLLRTPGAVEEMRRHSRGVTDFRLRLYWDQFKDIRVALPPREERNAILAFVDRETAKIDALVDEQRRLIALLKEKRQAVISHAVTKGLDPTVPMKNSGIEWLGDVPAHWKVKPLRAVSTEPGTVFIDGDWIESKDISLEGIRYITTGNVGEGRYKEQGAGFISTAKFEELNCTEVLPGDVLISRLNAPVGRACVVPDLGSRIVTSVDNVIVRPNCAVHRAFLVHVLSSAAYFFHTETLARGTTMQRVSRTILGNVRIALPSLEQQREIADYIDYEVGGLDALINEAELGTILLQERRAALVSAAVNGKIDVRGALLVRAEAA